MILHDPGFGIVKMVKTEQVQETMHDQMQQVIIQRLAIGMSFARDRFKSHRNVSQHGCLSKSGLGRGGKGQDIGGLVLLSPIPVERLHHGVIREQDTDLCALAQGHADLAHRSIDRSHDARLQVMDLKPTVAFDADVDLEMGSTAQRRAPRSLEGCALRASSS